MKKFIKKIIINLLRIFGIGIMNYNSLEELKKYVSAVRDLKILQRFNNQNAQKVLKFFLNRNLSIVKICLCYTN